MSKQMGTYVTDPRQRRRSIDGFVARPAQYVPRSAAVTAQGHRKPSRTIQKINPAYPLPSYSAPKRPRNVVRKPFLPFKFVVGLAAMLVVASWVAYAHFGNGDPQSVKVKADTAPVAQAQAAPTPVAATPAVDITADMNSALAAQPNLTAAATLIDLSTGKVYDTTNANQLFTAASTSKLVAIFDYVHQVELGKATLSRVISGDTAQDIIQRMIVYSDNNAWNKLNTYLTFAQEQRYLQSMGVSAVIQPDNLQFTTANMAKLLQLLYQGKLMNDTHRELIYHYMANTTVTNLIQAVLPADATVYHKYGQVLGVLHDASIVEYNGHQFVLVVYTNNPSGTTARYSDQVNLIHAVTTAAFNDITRQ